MGPGGEFTQTLGLLFEKEFSSDDGVDMKPEDAVVAVREKDQAEAPAGMNEFELGVSDPGTDVLPGNWATLESSAVECAERETRIVGRRRLGRVFRWLTRPRRIAVLMVCIWILSAADLAFTLQEASSHYFMEMNPIAAKLMDSPAHALVLYKFVLLMTGTVILIFLRHHAVAELACWFLLASCFYVAVRWYNYYEGVWGFDSQVFHVP